jgi:hypothetical protein
MQTGVFPPTGKDDLLVFSTPCVIRFAVRQGNSAFYR